MATRWSATRRCLAFSIFHVKPPEGWRRRHRDRRERRYGLLRVARPAQPPESSRSAAAAMCWSSTSGR
jgi:hypothetical protein